MRSCHYARLITTLLLYSASPMFGSIALSSTLSTRMLTWRSSSTVRHLRPRDAPTYSEEEVQALSRRSMCDSPLKSFEAKLRQYLRCLTHAKTFPRRLVTGASSLPESGDKLQAGSLLQRPTRNSPTKSSTALPIASMQRQLSLNLKTTHVYALSLPPEHCSQPK